MGAKAWPVQSLLVTCTSWPGASTEWWRPNAGRGWGWTGAWGNESHADPGPGSDWPGDPGPTEPPPDPAPRPESPPWGDDAGVFWTTAFDEGSLVVAPAEPDGDSSIFDRLARPGGGVSAGVAAALNFVGAGDAGGGGGGGALLDAFGAGREANADQDSWWGVASAVGSMVVGAALDPVGTVYDSAVATVEEWRTVWRNVGETEASLLGRVYITGGTAVASLVGIRQLSDFWTGVDAVDGHAQSFVENVVDAVIGASSLVGSGIAIKAIVPVPRTAQGPRLVHMTKAVDAISGSGRLGLPSDIYAGPASNAGRSGWALTRRTGLSPRGAYQPVWIPEAAEAAFRRPLPVGLFTAWQRVTGQRYTARGVIDLGTGRFTRTGVNRTQAGWYAIDVGITGTAVGAGGFYWFSSGGEGE